MPRLKVDWSGGWATPQTPPGKCPAGAEINPTLVMNHTNDFNKFWSIIGN